MRIHDIVNDKYNDRKTQAQIEKLEQTIWALWVMDATPATFEFAKEELNTNKNKYIKDILTDMANNDRRDIIAGPKVKLLRELGIHWPKLDVIERSLKSQT